MVLLVLALLVATLVVFRVAGARRWSEDMRALTGRLEAGRAPPIGARYHVEELDGLPEPVRRYFRVALQDGQPMVAAASIRMSGRINLSTSGEQWRPFASRQRVTTRRPGFLWDASLSMLPGLQVDVVDSYVAGEGLLRAALLGWFKVADLRGAGEIARGEFMRYFAECVWYPTALLPSQGVRWVAVDEHSANATMTDAGITLTLLFRFDDAGLIESFRAQSRGGMVGKVMVQAPWEGRFSNYQTREGMLVPFAGEVAWMRPQGRKTYFKGRVTSLDYEFV